MHRILTGWTRHARRRRALDALIMIAAAAAWSVGGCATSISDLNLVMVEPGEAVRLVRNEKKLLGSTGVWVDPRAEAAFRRGHIPGAINLPFQDVATHHRRLAGFDIIVVYGDGFRDARAEGMSKRLLELGYKDVRTLNGGLEAWQEAGNALETGP